MAENAAWPSVLGDVASALDGFDIADTVLSAMLVYDERGGDHWSVYLGVGRYDDERAAHGRGATFADALRDARARLDAAEAAEREGDADA